jgi:hypothetical protein
MVTGHFGFAAGVKAKERFVPLWALMLATVWLDILFIPLLVTGAETIDDAPGTDGGYGDGIIHADYTHSLVGALVISAVTGWLVTRWWGNRGGIVIGAVVFSRTGCSTSSSIATTCRFCPATPVMSASGSGSGSRIGPRSWPRRRSWSSASGSTGALRASKNGRLESRLDGRP